jgi:lipopolysaccharide transport system permease protein
LTVAYRDFRYVVPFMIQVWFFITPVIYPVSIVPERWQWIMFLNPMTGFIEGFRSAVLGRPFDFLSVGISSAVAVLVFFAGMAYFTKVERRFADII